MGIELIFRIAAIGIIVAVLNQLLARSGRDEYGMMITIAGIVMVLTMMISEINNLFELVQNVFGLY